MIGERFRETRDLHRMKAREFVAGRFQLNRRGVSCEIADVGPVEHFDRLPACPQIRQARVVAKVPGD